jgi:hypothetical protein
LLDFGALDVSEGGLVLVAGVLWEDVGRRFCLVKEVVEFRTNKVRVTVKVLHFGTVDGRAAAVLGSWVSGI